MHAYDCMFNFVLCLISVTLAINFMVSLKGNSSAIAQSFTSPLFPDLFLSSNVPLHPSLLISSSRSALCYLLEIIPLHDDSCISAS